jgi:hypothetical protein
MSLSHLHKLTSRHTLSPCASWGALSSFLSNFFPHLQASANPLYVSDHARMHCLVLSRYWRINAITCYSHLSLSCPLSRPQSPGTSVPARWATRYSLFALAKAFVSTRRRPFPRLLPSGYLQRRERPSTQTSTSTRPIVMAAVPPRPITGLPPNDANLT